MHVECKTKTITKAGIHAEVITDDGVVPLTIFVARDHNYTNRDFDKIKENMTITVSILGIRYELNDPYICAIATLVDTEAEKRRARRALGAKPAVTVTNEPAELDAEDL
jgi:hypothetical protein